MNVLENLLRPTAESREQARSKLLRDQTDLTRIELRRIDSLGSEIRIAERAIVDILEDLPRQLGLARERAVALLVAGLGGLPLPLPSVHDIMSCDWLSAHLREVEGFLRAALIVARQEELAALERKHAGLLAELARYE